MTLKRFLTLLLSLLILLSAQAEEPEYPLIPEQKINDKLFVLAYEDRPSTTWQKPVYGEGGLRVPQLYQADFLEVVCEYDGEACSVASSGCALTCLSMALYYVLGDTLQDPTTLFREVCAAGQYVGNGVMQSTLAELAQQHGVKALRLGKSSEIILQALERGYPLIASTGKGYFGNGHYIVLRGITDQGEIVVNDPNSKEKSAQTYSLKTIVRQLKGSLPLLAIMPEDGYMIINGEKR